MKAKPFPRKDVGCPNPHLRAHICLTPKQIRALISSLRSSEGIRSKEAEREYYRKLIRDIEMRVAV